VRAIAFAAVVAFAASGCSLWIDTVPDGWEPSRDPWCDGSRVYPIADATVAVAGLVFGGFLLSEHGDCTSENCRDITATFGVLSAAVVVTGAIAAKVGFDRTARCREAQRAHREWTASHSGQGPPGAGPERR